MKRIAYIELDTHAEIVKNYMDFIKNSDKIQCDFYLSKKIINIIGEINNVVQTSPKTIIKDLENYHYDEIIIGTAHRYFNIFNKIAKKYPTSIIIHNINFSKATRWQLFKTIFKNEQKYRLKLFLKEGLLTAPNLYADASKLYVLDEALSDSQYQYLEIFKNQYEAEYQSFNTIKIAIPGAVSQKRRDYKHILEKIQKFSINAEIIFCGKASGIELTWLREIEKNLPQNIRILYFTEKLETFVFDDLMRSAHLLWCPIQGDTTFMDIPEIYGKTKMSGNIGDAIKYNKISIFPKNYHSKYDFILNEEENIEKQIIDIIEKMKHQEP